MPSKMDNVSAIEEPTGLELQNAVGSAHIWEDIFAAIKASRKLKRLAGERCDGRWRLGRS